MVTKLLPEIDKVYFIDSYTLIHILEGSGNIQVDFENYFDWENKAIYLEKGQYIKFLSEDFVVRKIEFPDETMFRNKDVRVLFKHLISLGYIDFAECSDCKSFLDKSIFSEDTQEIIDISSKQWYWQNPFQASRSEYQIIFDVKEVIDEQFPNNLSNTDLVKLINENGVDAQALVHKKIGLSINKLLSKKRLVESKRKIAFSDKNIQEISFEMGYKDAAYFNRIFKNTTGSTPSEFRMNFDFKERDTFVQDIIGLIKAYHAEQRSLEFYADKMNLAVKTLSKKTRDKLNTSLGQLIRSELISSSKIRLAEDTPIHEIAYQLGFEEANHFSNFFKHYTGKTPTAFQSEKYNS
ncbi:helix-turn-helix domain-containing protein [Maribacter algarum]|uniref:Helix-turn-helix domain-containing protein n=1 Tax=Maribacter algarum (ex Zhang et al. 2020) TaxID=2578118 RepID=A0A5S3PXX2_9FLAO|nr:helix-turn-helix domain-containing protein [Maribacter algarum]TMM59102.1 helix-turn-helix domain-containing protein [Maribacter algarum]